MEERALISRIFPEYENRCYNDGNPITSLNTQFIFSPIRVANPRKVREGKVYLSDSIALTIAYKASS